MRIGIVGGGIVGRATARSYLEWAEKVCVYDVIKERRTHTLDEVLSCDLIFVCLPTPQESGSLKCDTSAIDSFFQEVGRDGWNSCNYVLRSTVPIGTTRRLVNLYDLPNLVHSPEFLTARCALTDACIPSRNIIGAPNAKQAPWAEDGTGRLLSDLYRQRFAGVPIFCMSSDESEAVKLFLNSFFAVKVAYFNEARTLADKMNLDWERIMEGVMADGRIAHAHAQVPGPDDKRGFGGTCLPKDLASLIAQFHDNGLQPHVTSAALSRNKIDRIE